LGQFPWDAFSESVGLYPQSMLTRPFLHRESGDPATCEPARQGRGMGQQSCVVVGFLGREEALECGGHHLGLDVLHDVRSQHFRGLDLAGVHSRSVADLLGLAERRLCAQGRVASRVASLKGRVEVRACIGFPRLEVRRLK